MKKLFSHCYCCSDYSKYGSLSCWACLQCWFAIENENVHRRKKSCVFL